MSQRRQRPRVEASKAGPRAGDLEQNSPAACTGERNLAGVGTGEAGGRGRVGSSWSRSTVTGSKETGRGETDAGPMKVSTTQLG